MGKYFGTDGFRGEANVTLTVEHAYKVGRFLGWYYGQKTPGEKCRIVIGKDTRRSSYMFEYSLVAGLTASGADVYLLHVTTTPSVSYVVRTEDFHCGIMISASHNPYYDNGIKVINEKGEKLEESVIEVVGRYGIRGARIAGASGVWIVEEGAAPRKICAIGVRASRFVTMHGFALNVSTDLEWFGLINPCGFVDRGVTSIERETGRTVPMDEVKKSIVTVLSEKLDVKIYNK